VTDTSDPIPQIARDDEAAGSGDLVTANIARLKALFPEIVTDGKVDFSVLRDLLGDAVENDEERYGLNWRGKRRARAFALTPSLGTLRPAPEDSVNWESTQNILIEGENLEVLKLLRRSYAGKVKLIYIDPPYNTGSDYVYPDNYRDSIGNYLSITGQVGEIGEALTSDREAAGRLHTDWLNMIYPRLVLAKELLSETGAIFISIANEEVSNLKSVCDDVFGDENFIECITWNKRVPKNDKGIGNIHDFIMVYVKNSSIRHEFKMGKEGISEIYDLVGSLKRNQVPLDEAEEQIKNLYKKNGYDRGITLYNSLDDKYRLWGKINMSWPNSNSYGPDYDVPHPNGGNPVKVPDRGWRWKKETFSEAAGFVDGKYSDVKELHDGSYMCGRIWFSPDENQQPSSVTYLDDVNDFLLRSILSMKSDGGVEVEGLLGGKNIFSHPKPTGLISTFIASRPYEEGDVILDFFAGSGTTAHATMKQNAIDGCGRRFIAVQLPEPLDKDSNEQKAAYSFLKRLKRPANIAELTKERLRRAGDKVHEEHPDAKVDTGFRVYKLATSNLKPWQPDAEDLESSILDAVDNVMPGRTEDDLLVELLLKTGIDLTLSEEKQGIAGQTVYALGGGTLMVCLGNVGAGDAEALGQGIADWVSELDPVQTTVYFKDTGLGTNGNRAATKANLAAILRQRLGDRIAKIASI